MATSVSSTGSDEDRTRFFKLSLVIIDELTQILRDLLPNEVPLPPTQIFNKVKQINYLQRLRPKQIVVIKMQIVEITRILILHCCTLFYEMFAKISHLPLRTGECLPCRLKMRSL